ncbi:MAG TPA: nitrilase-related carbon-nitrogen hydrolase [Nocardioidaceae bacterium]|nr:nitrilase-related carbon-nitrogen hydrolase [Nocardioidaceae bacterium]
MSVKIAGAQLTASFDPVANLHEVEREVKSAAEYGAQVVVFPEATMCRFGADLGRVAEPLDGAFANGVRRVAAEQQVVVVVGMFTPADHNRVHNTLLVTGPDVDCSYDKIHLYDAFGSKESETVAPGAELVTFTAYGLTIGLATCYDLRFADQFSALGRRGAELVVVPASWGEGPGKAEQWDLLVRARALDSQAWVLACDQAWRPAEGSDPLGVGNSMLVDPFGRPRVRLGHERGMLLGDLEPQLSHDARARIPLGRA